MSLTNQLTAKRKQFGRILVYSVLAILLYFFVLGMILNNLGYELLMPNSLLLIFAVMIAGTSYLISKSDHDFVSVYSILTIALAAITFTVSLFIHHASPIIYMFYVPIILLFYMLTNIRKAAFAAMICLLVCYGTPKLAQLIEIQVSSMEIVKNSFIEKLYDYSFLAIIIYISFLIIYYLNEFNRLEAKLQLAFQNGEESTANASDRNLIYRNEFQKEKLEKVYAQIVEFIEENKPYKDPDFSVAALSKDMNINATYLSKALNDHAGKKFRDFINEYRINHIVKQFNEKAHQKFTIEHLYLEAGFVQQSTFNRVFKKHTGYTPSQYIEILEK